MNKTPTTFRTPSNTSEPLLPELMRHLSPDCFLSHPLLVRARIDPQRAALVNKEYLAKKRAVKRAKSSLGDGSDYIFLHERPYRLMALERIANHLSSSDYWRLVGKVWMGSENI